MISIANAFKALTQQIVNKVSEKLDLNGAYGFTTTLEQEAERKLINYFSSQSPRNEFDYTSHGICGAYVRLIVDDSKPRVSVWLSGAYEDSEAFLISKTTKWRKADGPEDTSFKWQEGFAGSSFAEAVDQVVRDVFGAKYPHLQAAPRHTALDQSVINVAASPAP